VQAVGSSRSRMGSTTCPTSTLPPDESVHQLTNDTCPRGRCGQGGVLHPAAYRIGADPQLPSQKVSPRERRRPDPLFISFLSSPSSGTARPNRLITDVRCKATRATFDLLRRRMSAGGHVQALPHALLTHADRSEAADRGTDQERRRDGLETDRHGTMRQTSRRARGCRRSM